MIQPAATTRPAAAHARPAPPAARGGAIFVLPDATGQDDGAAGDLTTLPIEERQDDAAAGNALPIDPLAALALFQPFPDRLPSPDGLTPAEKASAGVVETRALGPSAPMSPVVPVLPVHLPDGDAGSSAPASAVLPHTVGGRDSHSPAGVSITAIDPGVVATPAEPADIPAVPAPAEKGVEASIVVPAAPPLPLTPGLIQQRQLPSTTQVIATAAPSAGFPAGPAPRVIDPAPIAPAFRQSASATIAVGPAAPIVAAATPAVAISLPTHAEAIVGDDLSPASPAFAPVPTIVGTTAPAAIVFGAAKAAAQRDEREDRLTMSTLFDPLPATIGADRPAIAAPGGGAQPSLDMHDGRWPHAMMAQIEALRDAADAADTRIRLVPDALGSIDIGVRQDGDTLHVRFTADQAQTRALLQDAQPRLAEAAEARGLRLGQASVDAGASGQGQQRPPLPTHEPRRPAPATTTRSADAEPADDDRLA